MALKPITSVWDRDNRNTINEAIRLINSLNSSIYELVVSGQLTPAQFSEMIAILNTFIKSGEITEDDLSEELISLITGNNNINLLSIPRNNSVTPEKTTFVFPGKNLFNKNGKFLENTTVDATEPGYYRERDGYLATDFIISVKPNTDYRATGTFFYVEFDKSDNVLSSGFADLETGLSTETGAEYIIISLQTSALHRFMLSETSTPINADDHYVPYKLTLSSAIEVPGTLTGSPLNEYIRIGKNLFNRDHLIPDMTLDTSGVLVPNNNRNATYPIPVESGATYQTTGQSPYALYSADMIMTRAGIWYPGSEVDQPNELTIRDDEAFLVVSPNKNFTERFMISKSDTPINADDHYVPFRITVDGRQPVDITEREAIQVFIDRMNEKAQEIGMLNTTFINSHGLRESGQVSTVKDVLTLLLHATKIKEIRDVWGEVDYTVTTLGARNINIDTSVEGSALRTKYTLLGAKTGTVYNPNTFNLVTLAKGDNGIYATAVMSADSTNGRYTSTERLLDHADKGTSLTSASLGAGAGAVMKIQPNQDLLFDNDHVYEFGKALNIPYEPASIIKLMTCIVMLENVSNLNETLEIRRVDLVGGSGNVLNEGERITYRDALYLIMLPSSNSTAHAVSREVGRKIAEANVGL